MKICTYCKEQKDATNFYKAPKTKDKLTIFCKDCGNKKRKEYYINNRDLIIRKQIEASKQQEKRYSIAYKEKRKAYSRNYFLTEYKNNDLFKLKHLCRCSVNRAFRGIKQNKNLSSLSIVGCDNWEILKNYIESMFIEGMTWENYGPNGWHVDHIIPLFTAKTEEDIFKLCHYTNLQPLWAEDNLKKGKK